MTATSPTDIDKKIWKKLKKTTEQEIVVGPLVQYLTTLGWDLNQIVFGKKEWRVPKTPSEASKREKGYSYDGFPCDIVVFDSPKHLGDYQHILFVVECKQPKEKAGVSQLETYLSNEPYAKLGVWANSAEKTATVVLLYRQPDGKMVRKRRTILDLPRPGEKISPRDQRLTYKDLATPDGKRLQQIMEDLLDKVVITDSKVTRREEQLDQLCNLLLLKLESDKRAKAMPTEPPFFRPLESAHKTAEAIRSEFDKFIRLYPEVFAQERDKEIQFSDETINTCVEELCRFQLLDVGVSAISLAFQILRTAALKQGEGQYFTPQPVIEAGVKLLEIGLDDIVIDPACGTGGFLVEVMLDIKRKYPHLGSELSRWAQTRIFGIDKDAVGVKLSKAIMQIAGDGSANCVRGDSVRTHLWPRDYPHLLDSKFQNGRFSVVVTNPPFGTNLKVSAKDVRLAGLDIATVESSNYRDLEIGLLFLNRAYQLLAPGGRVGIVLPETYFFSTSYQFIFPWLEPRLKPRIVADIPMEAFQGFCRAKTNFYIFEKIG